MRVVKIPHEKITLDMGGRGITVCKRWQKYENFVKDMGQRPDDLTLDRINNNNGYSPSNCRWVTRREQVRNRRDNIYVEYGGERLLLPDLAVKFNLARTTLYYRYHKGLRMPELIYDNKKK